MFVKERRLTSVSYIINNIHYKIKQLQCYLLGNNNGGHNTKKTAKLIIFPTILDIELIYLIHLFFLNAQMNCFGEKYKWS